MAAVPAITSHQTFYQNKELTTDPAKVTSLLLNTTALDKRVFRVSQVSPAGAPSFPQASLAITTSGDYVLAVSIDPTDAADAPTEVTKQL